MGNIILRLGKRELGNLLGILTGHSKINSHLLIIVACRICRSCG